MNYSSIIYLVPLLPLVSFVVLGLFGRKYFRNVSGIIGTLVLLTITLISLYTAYQYFLVDGKQDGVYQTLIPFNVSWLRFSDSLAIDLGITLDPISVMMLVVVSVVSLMVHIFNAWIGPCFQYFPDLHFLGVGRCIFIPVDRFLFR